MSNTRTSLHDNIYRCMAFTLCNTLNDGSKTSEGNAGDRILSPVPLAVMIEMKDMKAEIFHLQ